MTADMAIELKKYNVACVTLYPGAVLTENIDNVIKNDQMVSYLIILIVVDLVKSFVLSFSLNGACFVNTKVVVVNYFAK